MRCGEVIHHPVGGVIAGDRGVGEDLAASVPPDSDHRKPRLFAHANEAEFRISGGGERGQEICVEEFVVGEDAQMGGVGLTGGHHYSHALVGETAVEFVLELSEVGNLGRGEGLGEAQRRECNQQQDPFSVK